MQLIIRHITHYRYEVPPKRVTQALRLWPAASDAQRVRDWRVEVDGRRLPPTATDGFGNPVATHTADGPVSEVRILVHGRVDTRDTSGLVGGTVEPLPPAYFLYGSPLTRIDDSICELAGQTPEADGDIARMHALCQLVRDRVDYVQQQTDAETTASEALARGKGVCQDHAHLLAATARALGYPARYVSGYLCAGAEGAEAASHAWAEIHLADVGWIGFDAANRVCPDARYVRIACGRDYRDAAPVRGLQHGGASESLEVSVDIREHGSQ